MKRERQRRQGGDGTGYLAIGGPVSVISGTKLQVVLHATLLEVFARKVAASRSTLDDATVRAKAAQLSSTLIESVTVHPDGVNGAVQNRGEGR